MRPAPVIAGPLPPMAAARCRARPPRRCRRRPTAPTAPSDAGSAHESDAAARSPATPQHAERSADIVCRVICPQLAAATATDRDASAGIDRGCPRIMRTEVRVMVLGHDRLEHMSYPATRCVLCLRPEAPGDRDVSVGARLGVVAAKASRSGIVEGFHYGACVEPSGEPPQ